MESVRSTSAASSTLRSARFRAVIGMVLVIMIGFGIIVPALPTFTKKFGVGEAGVGLVVFAFSLTRLFGDLFAGSLIDRFGERAVTALGAAVVGVSSLAAGASKTFAQLVVLRGLGGFGSAFFLAGLMAYLIGTTPPDERGRAMSIFQGSFGMGFLIGPLIGGLMLAVAAPNVPLYVYGAMCLVCVPLCLRALGAERVPAEMLASAPALRESGAAGGDAPGPRIPSWRRLRPLLGNSAYRAALAASALIFLIGQAEFTLIPSFWHDTLHQDKVGSGIPFAIYAFFGLAVMWHAGALTDRKGRKFALVPALAVTAVGTALLGVSGNALVFLAFMALTGASNGYMRPGPSAVVGDVSTPTSRAAAVSGYRIAGDMGAIVGPLLAGVVAQYVSFRAAFYAIGGVGALVFVVAMISIETLPSLPRSS